jgi:hypothetical protein
MEPMKPLIFVTLSAAFALAQAPAPAPVAGTIRLSTGGQAIEGRTVEFVSAMNVGPVISGAPYSAEAVNESVQTLADGNRIVDKQTTKQYRDSQGRERREIGPMIVISDPVAKLRYTLHTETKTAEKMPMEGAGNVFVFANRVGDFQRFENNVFTSHVTVARATLVGKAGEEPAQEPVTTLSTKNIEGLQANGTKTVRTIPAGAVGNERPIEVVDENYTSPELGVTILTTHSDPRSGVNTYKLTNIQRADPPRSLFEVPSDYQVMEPGRGRFELNRKEE